MPASSGAPRNPQETLRDELRALTSGETLARVELRDGATGELLATLAVPVVVD